MTQATVTKKTTKKEWQGKRAILWNPDVDPRDVPPPLGFEQVRQYIFSYVDEERTAHAKEVAKETLSAEPLVNLTHKVPSTILFKEFRLTPGLNWVSAAQWDEVQMQSTARYDADVEAGSSQASDEIADLLAMNAIVVFKPKPAVESSKRFEGRLDDYDLASLRALFTRITDIPSVERFLQDATSPEVRAVIQNRLDQLNQAV